jgi:hypothetical protein
MATPATQLAGTSKPPCSAKRPAYSSKSLIHVFVWYEAPTERCRDHSPRYPTRTPPPKE